MSQFTKNIPVDGDTNLMVELIIALFRGTARLYTLHIINDSDEPVYVTLHDSATNAPDEPTDGVEISAAKGVIEYKLTDTEIDAGLVWLYSANPVTVKVTITGYGI